MKPMKLTVVLLMLAVCAVILTACGGSEQKPAIPAATRTPRPTAVPRPTAMPKPAAPVDKTKHTSGDFEYLKLKDGTIQVCGYLGNETAVTIPAELDGLKVTQLEKVFYSSKTLQSAVIPEALEVKAGEVSFRLPPNGVALVRLYT